MKRPRLLYLAYHFPPAPAIGGVRAWNSARRLSELGWDVTVVTPRPEVWRKPEEPERAALRLTAAGISRLSTGHAWPMLAPDYVSWPDRGAGRLVGGACRILARRLGVENAAGWAYSASRACAKLLPGDFDLVLATGGPYVSFGLAAKVAARLDCPYVLDYRDPWTGNPHVPRPGAAAEAELLRGCARATVVSPSWKELIGGLFDAREKLHVVSNGYEPGALDDVRGKVFERFAVVYAGTLYPPKRVLDPVLRAFASFSERRPARFHYYGDYEGPVREAAARAGCADRVELHGRVSRREALEAQKGAGLLVVVSSVQEDGGLPELGTVTGKVFDCIALGRPALVVAPRGGDLYRIAETAGGMRCFTGSDVAGMARYMEEAEAGLAPPPRDPLAYSWDAVGRRLDEVLRGALEVRG